MGSRGFQWALDDKEKKSHSPQPPTARLPPPEPPARHPIISSYDPAITATVTIVDLLYPCGSSSTYTGSLSLAGSLSHAQLTRVLTQYATITYSCIISHSRAPLSLFTTRTSAWVDKAPRLFSFPITLNHWASSRQRTHSPPTPMQPTQN
jgi:hypothetical protein